MASVKTPAEQFEENVATMISSCCKAWHVFDNNMVHCSSCGQLVKTLGPTDTITTSIIYNSNSTQNTSYDLVHNQFAKSGRYANDITLELCSTKCPKCKSLSRYMRDATQAMYYVCSNVKCRNVFYDK